MIDKIHSNSSHNISQAIGNLTEETKADSVPTKETLRDFLNGIYPQKQSAEPARRAFSIPGKEALSSIAPKSMFLILNAVNTSQVNEGSSEGSLFNKVYIWLKSENNGMQLSESEFYEQLQNATTIDILTLVEKFMNSYGDSDAAELENQLLKKIKIMSSENFKNECKWALDNLSAFGQVDPYYDMVNIFEKENAEKEKYLKSMKSEEFKDFCNDLKNTYEIGIKDNLLKFLNTFIYNVGICQSIKSQKTRNIINILKKYFPEMRIKTNTVITYSQMFDKLSEEDVMKKVDLYDKISTFYGYKIQDERSLMNFLTYKIEDIEILLNPETKNAWTYIKENYNSQLNFDFKDLHNFFKKTGKQLAALKINARELDAFLKLFGTNIMEINFLNSFCFTKITGEDMRSMAKEEKVKEYLTELFKKYPSLRESLSSAGNYNKSGIIENLAANYKNNKIDDFYKMNELLKNLGCADEPEIDTENYELKMEILKYAADKKFDKLVFGNKQKFFSPVSPRSEKNEKLNAEKLKIITNKIKSGAFEKLYDALTREWRLENIEFGGILFLLAENEENFYLDKNNGAAFDELNKKYNFSAGRNGAKVKTLKDIMIYSSRSREYTVKTILASVGFFNDDKVRNYIFKYMPEKFRVASSGISLENMEKLNILAVVPKDDFCAAIDALEKKYGLAAEDIKNLFGNILSQRYSEKQLKIFYCKIREEKTRETFNGAKEFFKNDKLNKAQLIMFAAIGADVPELSAVLEMLRELKIDFSDKDNFDSLLGKIFSSKEKSEMLINPDFIDFYKKTTDAFYDGVSTVNILSKTMYLYSQVNGKPDDIKLLFSQDCKNCLKYIKKKFALNDMDPAMLVPILKMAKDFDEKKIDEIIEALGEKISVNDLYLIIECLKNPELKELLFNKDAMIKELASMYNLPESKRMRIDEAAAMERRIKEGGDKVQIEGKIREIKASYTERPPLNDLPKIQLLRLVLLKRALDNPSFTDKVGAIVSADFKDKGSEYGGIIDIGANGALRIEAVDSSSTSNGAYENDLYYYLAQGIARFHCHAVDDSELYTGPSGWLGCPQGDIDNADYGNFTGVVITPKGHPKDKDGKEDETKIIVNIDLYFVDKNNPGKPVARIIDMGDRVINRP